MNILVIFENATFVSRLSPWRERQPRSGGEGYRIRRIRYLLYITTPHPPSGHPLPQGERAK